MRLINDNTLRVFVLGFGWLVFLFFLEYVWVGPVGYLFRIDVGLGGLLRYNFLFFFIFSVTIFLFIQILVQNLFGIQILRVFLILLKSVSIFLKGKQIKKFKLLYIYIYFFFFQVRVFQKTPWTLSGVTTDFIYNEHMFESLHIVNICDLVLIMSDVIWCIFYSLTVFFITHVCLTENIFCFFQKINCNLLFIYFFFLESFNLQRLFLMIDLYHRTKTPISFFVQEGIEPQISYTTIRDFTN